MGEKVWLNFNDFRSWIRLRWLLTPKVERGRWSALLSGFLIKSQLPWGFGGCGEARTVINYVLAWVMMIPQFNLCSRRLLSLTQDESRKKGFCLRCEGGVCLDVQFVEKGLRKKQFLTLFLLPSSSLRPLSRRKSKRETKPWMRRESFRKSIFNYTKHRSFHHVRHAIKAQL